MDFKKTPDTLVVVAGPTAVGKTKAAIKLALWFDTEIISADSRQIYKELNIGTAIPSKEDLAAVTHHFIQTHSIFENYNAGRYESEVLETLGFLFKKYNTVILEGGSMLYIDAVCKGIDSMPDANPELRDHLKKRLEDEGLESLRLQLKKVDPDYYHKTDLKNPARIIRALEIYIMTGKPYSSFRTAKPKERSFRIIKTGINTERENLHKLINLRTDRMIQSGLEEEARKFYPFRHLNALNTVGYREFFDFFDGKISREKAIELIKRNTRRYARKQLTWFNRAPDFTWFKPGQEEEMLKYIKSVQAQKAALK
jgi:tRNA dimethylallyltransferase